jgi:hypothetical protein
MLLSIYMFSSSPTAKIQIECESLRGSSRNGVCNISMRVNAISGVDSKVENPEIWHLGSINIHFMNPSFKFFFYHVFNNHFYFLTLVAVLTADTLQKSQLGYKVLD